MSESSSFIENFISVKKNESVIKVNFKENSESDIGKKYEFFIDYSYIIENITLKRFEKHKTKLDAYINQYVPSNTKWIINLNDNSSRQLATYILNSIKGNYLERKTPQIISHKDFSKFIKKSDIGTVLIVGSCISTGKNLLYLSRALRNFSNLRIVYFTSIFFICSIG